jgi:hypothetical protein
MQLSFGNKISILLDHMNRAHAIGLLKQHIVVLKEQRQQAVNSVDVVGSREVSIPMNCQFLGLESMKQACGIHWTLDHSS